MHGWSEKLLACARHKTVLKSVVQAIPMYSMSTFLLTKKVCKSLTSPMAKIFWSSSLDKNVMHRVSWKNLATPKCKGDMGFWEPHQFNLALSGKHRWRFLTNPDSLCARVLKWRHFPDTDFMHASVPKSAYATWRAIIAGREALVVGLIKRVGMGLPSMPRRINGFLELFLCPLCWNPWTPMSSLFQTWFMWTIGHGGMILCDQHSSHLTPRRSLTYLLGVGMEMIHMLGPLRDQATTLLNRRTVL